MLDIDENSQNILNKIKDTSSQLPEGTARTSVFFIVVLHQFSQLSFPVFYVTVLNNYVSSFYLSSFSCVVQLQWSLKQSYWTTKTTWHQR